MWRCPRPLEPIISCRLAWKKSPTSAWPRSTCSTRKVRRPPKAAHRSHGCAVAAAVAVAVAAVLAVLAEVVAVAVAAAAALRGVPLLLKAGNFPPTVTTLIIIGRARRCRPGQSMFYLSRAAFRTWCMLANDGQIGFTLSEKTPRPICPESLVLEIRAASQQNPAARKMLAQAKLNAELRTRRPPHGKDVPQFAPNFTVYVLPPDQVCLYSEDQEILPPRRTILRLASMIGEGEKSLRTLAGELSKSFPPRKSKRRSND